MTAYQPVTRETPSLSEQLQALYDETRAKMGDEDLAQIRQVAAYSRAIKARSRELLMEGKGAHNTLVQVGFWGLAPWIVSSRI